MISNLKCALFKRMPFIKSSKHTRFPADLHSSNSIEGEYVPVEGDEVSYKICSIPPKHEKIQAVEVTITHLAPGTKHETWSGAVFES